MNKKIIFLVAVFFIFAPLVALKAEDNKASPDDPSTQREKGVFAFFSLVGEAPDFEEWITTSEDYAEIPEKLREDYLINQSLRLGTGYSLFDPQKSFLNIETVVSVHYVAPKEDNPGRIFFQFPNQQADYIPTFSYPYVQNEWVSLIINKLALFAELPLTKEHYEKISEHMFYENQNYDAVLTIQVRPKEADHSKPIKIGSIKQWIMIGEIAYMKCEVDSDKDGRRQQLWDYVAPWYEEEYRLKNLPEDMKYPHPFDIKK